MTGLRCNRLVTVLFVLGLREALEQQKVPTAGLPSSVLTHIEILKRSLDTVKMSGSSRKRLRPRWSKDSQSSLIIFIFLD
jgi:hypothetical protein